MLQGKLTYESEGPAAAMKDPPWRNTALPRSSQAPMQPNKHFKYQKKKTESAHLHVGTSFSSPGHTPDVH